MNGAPFGIDFHHSRTSSRPFCAFKKYDSKFSEKTEYGNSTTLVKHAFMRLVIPAGPKRCKGYWIPRPPDFNGNDESKMDESETFVPQQQQKAHQRSSRGSFLPHAVIHQRNMTVWNGLFELRQGWIAKRGIWRYLRVRVCSFTQSRRVSFSCYI